MKCFLADIFHRYYSGAEAGLENLRWIPGCYWVGKDGFDQVWHHLFFSHIC
jgi:hypothetical protein